MKRFFFLLLALLLAPPVFAQEPAALSLAEYRRLVDACRRAVEGTPPLSPERAGALSRRLRAVRRVTGTDGRQVAVNNDESARLLAAASRSQTTRAAAKARFQTLQALLAPPRTALAVPGDPRQLAAEILAGAEFRRAAALEAADKPAEKGWWERWLEDLGRSIARFLERFSPRGPDLGTGGGMMGETFLFLLYFLGGVAALVGLYALARALREGRSGRRRRVRAVGALTEGLDDDVLADPLGAARARAGAGDHRAALRLTYLACLRRLEGAGLLVLEQDKTNWEYQRALRARSREAHDILLPVTRDFDRVWYGQMPATPDEYERALRAHGDLPEPTAHAGDDSR